MLQFAFDPLEFVFLSAKIALESFLAFEGFLADADFDFLRPTLVFTPNLLDSLLPLLRILAITPPLRKPQNQPTESKTSCNNSYRNRNDDCGILGNCSITSLIRIWGIV